MGFFSQHTPTIQARNALDDYWYKPVGNTSLAGLRVDADTALKISTVWACVGLISEILSSIPLILYQRLPDDRRQRASSLYLYRLLHDQPNRWQSAMEFREMLTGHALLRGNGYARILPGPTGFAQELIPLNPDRMTPEKLPDGAIRYNYRQDNGQTTIYNDDEIFHLRGHSKDGLVGMGVVEYARESFGLAMAAESYGARFFSQDARPGGVLQHPGKLSTDAQKRLSEGWEAAHSAGLGKSHRVAILEEGMSWHQVGMTSEDAQFLQTRQFQVADMARWFRVPLHLIQETEKSTSWGSGIEQLSLGFVIYTLGPWARRWEQAISRDLIVATDQFYAEHLFDGLLRGDLKTRYDAYAVARNWGWLSANDVRRIENMDLIENGDDYLQPLNMTPSGTTPTDANPQPTPMGALANGHYQLLLHEAATRIIRREVAVISKAAKKHADDPEGWRVAVEEFYGEHTDYVVQSLRVGRKDAEAYTIEQRRMLLEHGVGCMEDWEIQRVGDLIALAGGTPSD